VTADSETCTYAEFGERFFDLVVTADRLAAAIAGLAGRPLDIGPVAVGPGGIARVTVTGQMGAPLAAREDAASGGGAAGGGASGRQEPLRFRVTLPLEIDLLVELPGQDARFHGSVTVGVRVTARAVAPLRLVLDVEPPGADDIEVDLVADGVRASLLRAAAGIDEEMRKYVARYVAAEIDKPKARAARDIDLLARIDSAFSGRPRPA
jgi:hypothetical protein